MTINEGLRGVAGTFVLLSVALAVWVSPWWLAFTAFVGLNLLQSAFTHTCPMMWILRKAGLRDDAVKAKKARQAPEYFGGDTEDLRPLP